MARQHSNQVRLLASPNYIILGSGSLTSCIQVMTKCGVILKAEVELVLDQYPGPSSQIVTGLQDQVYPPKFKTEMHGSFITCFQKSSKVTSDVVLR